MSDADGKRQPSVKHTLDEVLKGLQDLVRNELAEEHRPLTDADKARQTSQASRQRPAKSVDAIPVLTGPIGHAPPGAGTTTRQAARAPAAIAVAKPLPASDRQPELPLSLSNDLAATADDIPILQHVVVPPPVPVGREQTAAASARRIAHAVAERLNAELGRTGTSRLEPAIIRRLEDLLREALERQAAESPRS